MLVKNKRLLFYAGLMLFSLLISAGSTFGTEPPANQQFTFDNTGYSDTIPGAIETGLLTNPWLLAASDTWLKDTEQSFLLAQADKEPEGGEKPISPECKALRADPMANVGEVLRAGCEPTLAQMSRLMDNPLGNVAMWINQLDVWVLENDAVSGIQKNKLAYMGILQFPKGVSENWNLINRVVYSFVSQPLDEDKISNIGDYQSIISPPSGFTEGPPINILQGRTFGFGDMYYVGLFSPKKGIKHSGGATSVWGVGLDLGFPTATSDLTGTGKWTAGPAALYAYMGPKWKIGGLWQQYWDYAGKSDRSDVNLTNIQYFVYYSVSDTFSIGAGPNIIGDWEQNKDNRWTVPIGIGANTTVNFGKVPVRLGVEAHYSVVRLDAIPAPLWDFRFMVIPAVPSGLIPFLN